MEVRMLSGPFADLDPSRVCKGKGVVTLRATRVHIDDEGCITEEPNVITTQSESVTVCPARCWTNCVYASSRAAQSLVLISRP